MRVILFGGSGMVGQGVLHACLQDAGVERVLLVVRKPTGLTGGKVEELVHADFYDWSGVEDRFAGYDVCLYSLGASVVGLKETEYRHINYDLAVGVAQMLLRVGDVKTFVYVSGRGTDANGRAMWARVKGETENALMAMPFAQVFCFRPGYIQPRYGSKSKVAWYNAVYTAVGWSYGFWRRLIPPVFTDTDEVSRAMLAVARTGYPTRVLETTDIQRAAKIY